MARRTAGHRDDRVQSGLGRLAPRGTLVARTLGPPPWRRREGCCAQQGCGGRRGRVGQARVQRACSPPDRSPQPRPLGVRHLHGRHHDQTATVDLQSLPLHPARRVCSRVGTSCCRPGPPAARRQSPGVDLRALPRTPIGDSFPDECRGVLVREHTARCDKASVSCKLDDSSLVSRHMLSPPVSAGGGAAIKHRRGGRRRRTRRQFRRLAMGRMWAYVSIEVPPGSHSNSPARTCTLSRTHAMRTRPHAKCMHTRTYASNRLTLRPLLPGPVPTL